jgi:hypothetical protein
MNIETELARIEQVLLLELNAIYRLRCEIAGGSQLPSPPDWVNVAEAAHRLSVSETTAWRHAVKYGANWPHPGVRLIDFSRLRHVRPPKD